MNVGKLFDNDSLFGRIMTRIWVIVAANIMFVLFSIPVVTLGASYTALCYVCLRAVKEGDINPIGEFWKGFKMNFKQATIVETVLVLLGLFLYGDYKICTAASGAVAGLKYPILAIAFLVLGVGLYLFATMAAFEDSLKKLLSNSIFFAVKNPVKMLAILFLHIFWVMILYLDTDYRPLIAFIAFFGGFGIVGMISAKLWYKEFKPYLSADGS
jgi:uncharacterized membrane protein YesL